jgi:hypothetical protein
MPDDYHPPMPPHNPENIDLGALKTDLEFLIERVERFRKEPSPQFISAPRSAATCFPPGIPFN